MGRTIKLHFISFNAKWSYVKIVVADGVIVETTLYDVQTEILRGLAGAWRGLNSEYKHLHL